MGDGFTKQIKAPDGFGGVHGLPGLSTEFCSDLRGPLFYEGIEFADKEVVGDLRLELANECDEDLERYTWVFGIVQLFEGPGHVVKILVGFGNEVMGQATDEIGGQGVGMDAGFDGVAIAFGGAARARTEDGVAVGAAEVEAAHGPIAAARGVALDFIWIPGHGEVQIWSLEVGNQKWEVESWTVGVIGLATGYGEKGHYGGHYSTNVLVIKAWAVPFSTIKPQASMALDLVEPMAIIISCG